MFICHSFNRQTNNLCLISFSTDSKAGDPQESLEVWGEAWVMMDHPQSSSEEEAVQGGAVVEVIATKMVVDSVAVEAKATIPRDQAGEEAGVTEVNWRTYIFYLKLFITKVEYFLAM